MFGVNQISTISMALIQNCKQNLKFSSSIISVRYRNKSTAINGDNNDQQSVADFYSGRSVFITGGTGFLGKVFIEKLLYSCTDIDKVYILIRDKKGQSTTERLHQVLNNPIYNRVKKFKPLALKKVVPIAGDISQPELGISREDQQTLIDKVSVVFHSAATVKFFEPLSVAMRTNFEGTRQIVNLSKRIKNLHNFVYVSTAYSQTIYPVLEEKVYDAPRSVEEIYDFIKKYDHDMKKTKEFMCNHPTTYAFSKCVSENYAATSGLPVTLVRPSVVGATIREPIPGWLDNWYGMTGVATDVARGLNCYCIGRPDRNIDLIPVDYTTNLSLIAAAKYKRGNTVPVYNSATTGCNPITLKAVFDTFISENEKYGCYDAKPYLKYFQSKAMLELATLLVIKTPAYVNDFLLRLKGEEPRYVRNIKRVLLTRYSMENFMSNDWVFKVDAARALYASLSEHDKAEFPCDPADIEWDSYLKDNFVAVTKHLLPAQLQKEKASIMPKQVNKAITN